MDDDLTPSPVVPTNPVEALSLIEHELTVLGRRAEWFRMHSIDGSGAVLDRSAYLLLGHLLDNGPARLTAIGASFALDISTVSRQVATLASGGLVERATDPSDRRATLIRLTPYGRQRYERIRAARLDNLAELTEAWPEADRCSLGALLARLNEGIASREHRRPAAGVSRSAEPEPSVSEAQVV